jgi:hypothetical protein
MTFPLYIFLIAYFVFLFVWFVFCLAALYHMFKFGFKNFTTFFTSFIFIGVAIVMLVFSYNYIAEIDWKTNVTILDGMFDFNIETPFD